MSTFMIQINPNPTPTPDQPAVFAPPDQPAKPYDTICWHNADDQAHYPAPIVNGSVVTKGWFDFQIPAGGTSDTLAPGPTSPPAQYVLHYACARHPKETGTITVAAS